MKDIIRKPSLKECPFCNEQQNLHVDAVRNNSNVVFGCQWTAKIVCLSCFASTGPTKAQPSKEEAVKLAVGRWNNRKEGSPIPHYETVCSSRGKPVVQYRLGYECPFCGDTGIKAFCPNCGAEMIRR